MAVNRLMQAADYARRNFAASHPSLKPSERIWLISERGYDAQDNGAAFFEWLCAQHPEIHAVYVISPGDADYAKMHALGDTVECGSKRHYELMYQAEALISTHAFGYTPDMVIYDHLARAGLFHPDGISVFLQHGLLDKQSTWLNRKAFKPDLFEISAWPEYEIAHLFNRQPAACLMTSGQCRYDKLYLSQPGNTLLIMPTWRKWLAGVTQDEFTNSEYCHEWNRVLSASAIGDLPHDWHIVFRLHPEMAGYYDKFHTAFPDKVTISVNDDIGDLIRQSSAVLTDYSSVAYDFIFRQLPVTFFQFDRERYISEHYSGICIKPETFGRIASTPENAAADLVKSIGDIGSVRIPSGFFIHKDAKNCQRTYDAICEKLACR